MSSRVSRASNSITSSSISPSKSPVGNLEILYNTAVQSFVRRDHVKTQASLSRLLDLLVSSNVKHTSNWFDSQDDHMEFQNQLEWIIKTLKLVISSHASLYTDPPQHISQLDSQLQNLLPPTPPRILLDHLRTICDRTYFPHRDLAEMRLLPPQIISTLLLASIKLRPAESALSFAHSLAEEWLSLLPDSFILSISPRAGSLTNPKSAEGKRRIESAREGYLKVVELFVGEVLAREGEWDMARGFLDGEVVMSSKRKETLFRHLRALQTKPRSTTSSPSSSGVLPSPNASGFLPPKSPSPARRSRSGTTSSESSSEATARPNTNPTSPTAMTGSNAALLRPNAIDRKGKGRESDGGDAVNTLKVPSRGPIQDIKDNLSDATDSTFAPPRRIFVNPSNPESSKRQIPIPSSTASTYTSLFDLIPPSIRARLTSPYALSIALPLPIILVLMVLGIRRRLRRRQTELETAVATGTTVAAVRAVDDVRDRLRRARGGNGLIGWFLWYLRWWLEKFKGVWKLGTTITWM